MSDTTTNAPDVEDEESNENLVRDYLLHQLQLNLLHEQWQGKPHAEAGLIDPDKMYELENYQEMLKEIEHLSVKRQTILDKFGGDVKAYMVDHHAQEEQLAKLKTEVQNQREMIAMLNARISEINSKLQSP
uniref:Mediator of RNA polymerase II transcription subunit 28 n=1 Tax=Loa loa TaxID=7209 RepID=A0A1I7VTN1_LOALO